MPDPSRDMVRYEHDCLRCEFVGQHRQHDVYVCPQGSTWRWPTVVLRYGDGDPDYHSGAHLVDDLPTELRDRAAAMMKAWRDA